MSERTATRTGRTVIAAGVAGIGLGLAGALLWRTQVPELDLPALDAGTVFGVDELERIERYRSVARALRVGATGLEVLVLGLLAWRGARLARRLGAVQIALAAAFGVWLVQLPVGAFAHWWRRRYGLSEQDYVAWLGDSALSLAVRAVLLAAAVAGVVVLARRLGPRWWLAGGVALTGLAAAFVLLQPLVVQPLFNRFEPLPDRSLAAEIERVAARMGVDVDTVQVADASRRTTTANAYVAGIGPTRRVVLYDTMLDGRFTRGEIVFVAAHELGHVERRHLWRGLAWFALLALPGAALVAWVTERAGGVRDPAVVPVGLLVALLFYLGTLPLQNAVSRRYEAEADWLALVATDDPASGEALDRRFVTTSLADPDPPGWAYQLLSTHPSPLERIGMARAYATTPSAPSP
jgi:STE24 endopeptidase